MTPATRIGETGRSCLAALAAAACVWLACGLAARADDVRVSAALAEDSADPGQPVDYTITVNGATEAQVSENVQVDGLTITYGGASVETQVQFGTDFGSGQHFQRSVVETYSVVAQRAGQFVIPAQEVVVDGRTYMTQPVTLNVGATADGGSDQDRGLYYAEIVLPQDTAYIGQALPAEVRIYVDSRVRAQLQELPEVTAQGCTIEPVKNKPDQSEVTRGGRDYIMVSFKTAVTAATAGKLKVGPVTCIAEAQIPENRPRGFGGMFDDPQFNDPAFANMFQMMSPPQQITIRGDPVELTAKPLPAEGQPASFTGAVGRFTLETAVKPTMVQAGDPITITNSISGRGNFDRVTAPQIVNPNGWRTYPPSSKFEADDDDGTSGVKTFDMAAIPETNKTESPTFQWSYFDPERGKYVTLTGEAWPIKIEGQIAAQATPAISQPVAPSEPNAPKQDIAYIRADSTGWGATFQPLYENRLFWAAQGAPLLALLAFAGVQVSRKRAADEQARRRAQWRREKDAALAAMQRRDVAESELYQAAARALRLEAAIQTGREPETLDGAEVARARELDEETGERVRRVFDLQAEALYAGSSGGSGAASTRARLDALETVKGYENAKQPI